MKKIPSLFERDWEHDRSLVLNQQVPGTEWVTAGEGIATVKLDGSACLVRDGKLYKRYDAKHGKTPPAGWEPCQDEPDPVTGHWPGWLPVSEDNPQDKWYLVAWSGNETLPDGTYEIIGPHFQSNPYGEDKDRFVRHGVDILYDVPRDFDGLKEYLRVNHIEGIVWHHPDGRMVKIKRRDFGWPWPLRHV